MGEDGLVDIDKVQARAYEAMKHCGSIEIAGFRMMPDDVNALANYIKRA